MTSGYSANVSAVVVLLYRTLMMMMCVMCVRIAVLGHVPSNISVEIGNIPSDAEHADVSVDGGGGGASPAVAFARSIDPERRAFYHDTLCNYTCERVFNGGGQRDRDRRRQRTADNQRAQRSAATLIATDAAGLYEDTGECVASSSANAWCD